MIGYHDQVLQETPIMEELTNCVDRGADLAAMTKAKLITIVMEFTGEPKYLVKRWSRRDLAYEILYEMFLDHHAV